MLRTVLASLIVDVAVLVGLLFILPDRLFYPKWSRTRAVLLREESAGTFFDDETARMRKTFLRSTESSKRLTLAPFLYVGCEEGWRGRVRFQGSPEWNQ